MDRELKDYEIKFIGLKEGSHKFDFEIDRKFFDIFEYSEFEEADLKYEVLLEKKKNLMELDFKMKGKVKVTCDLTTEPFWMDIEDEFPLVVKFGDEYDDSDENILVLPHSEIKINVAQYLYEMAVLAIPYRRIHPDVESGKMGSELLEKLRELSPGYTKDVEETDDNEIDSRWDQLKDLLK